MSDISNIQILLLSVVQGVTEFLPISSSGHLLVSSRILGWPDQGLLIDVAVHLGSLFAVMAYHWRQVLLLVQGVHDALKFKKSDARQLLLFLIIATLPLIPAGLFLSSFMTGLSDGALRMPAIVAGASIFFALILWMADRYNSRIHSPCPDSAPQGHFSYSIRHALLVGGMQIFALIPGASRSGLVMTACMFLGAGRKHSVDISLLLSIPAIGAAAALMGYKIWQSSNSGAIVFSDLLQSPILLAMLGAFIAAYLTLYFLLKHIEKIGFSAFIIYRIIFGLYLLYYFYL